jgi:hypothetical protein
MILEKTLRQESKLDSAPSKVGTFTLLAKIRTDWTSHAVKLGRAYEAVDELEKVTGLKLAGSHPRVPVEPKIKGRGSARL